ncbi:ATP-binding cassette domain-containing protein [Microbacterium sp. NPDC089695]|uniref:ATP-binding cassette domain-containing protein n=1 Tax=Microbacterium sp. NPDC089695 TaxID=3364198 RepID=UPI003809E4BE
MSSLSFAYSKRAPVLRDVSFAVERGERVGLVGPNGSGKSTLIRLVADLLQIGDGGIRIAGRPHRDRTSREQLAYIASNDNLPQFLTGVEYIDLLHRLYHHRPDPARLDDLLSRYQLTSRAGDLIEDYSHGMRKKIQLVATLLLDRPLTVIDETLNGVDVDALFEFETDAGALDSSRALLLCSHDFRLLEAVCDRIIVLCHGEIVFDLPMDRLRAGYGSVAALVRHAIDLSRPTAAT